MTPFLSEMTVDVESTYMYYWLADACQERNIPFFLGHTYYIKTIHGGKTKTDRRVLPETTITIREKKSQKYDQSQIRYRHIVHVKEQTGI